MAPAGWEPALAAGTRGCPGVLQVTVPRFHQDNNTLLVHPHPFWAGGGSSSQTPPSWDAAAFLSREDGFVPRRLLVAQPPNPSGDGAGAGSSGDQRSAGDRDSSLLELGGVFVVQSPLPPPGTGLSAAPRHRCSHGQFSAFEFRKTILRKISPRRCWLSSRLEIAFPLLEIPPGVSDGECTTSLSILSCCHTF